MDETMSKHPDMQPDASVKEQIHGHMLSPNDLDNPQNWPIYRKVYVSAVATAFAFVVAFGLTSYTVGISGVREQFNVSLLEAISGYSLYLFGIFFAPIYTPHISERYGRSPVYMVALPIWMLFVLGTGLAQNFAAVAICRFFAGLVGGSCLVLIEGTFADVWSAKLTGTYYSFLTLASYVGAACGPLIGGFVFAATSWRWMQWITLMLGLAAYLLGIGAPETYAREIVRRRAKRHGVQHQLPLAESGVTLAQMAQITLFTPMRMLFAEPIVILISLYLALNFAVLFQWFITVPVALAGNYNFSIQQVGLAFIAAILGVVLAAITTSILDGIFGRRAAKKNMETMTVSLEYRLYPAMIGCFFLPASLFWIGWTATPSISWASPVLGTLLYVWGSSLTLIAFISYLFDAYPAAGTLSALTAAACLRILCAGWLPLVIVQMFTGLTPAWALSTFGFIGVAFIPIPFVLFIFGEKWRTGSRYAGDGMVTDGQEGSMGEIENATV